VRQATVVIIIVISMFGLTLAQSSKEKPVLPSQIRSPFPMEKGTVLSYAGTIRWTDSSNCVREKQIEWSMRVVARFLKPNMEIAYIAGHPLDLCWYEEGKAPGNYLIARYRRSYYLVSLKSDQWREVAEKIRVKDNGLVCPGERIELFLDLPLLLGMKFGGDDPARSDYCWQVEKVTPANWNELPVRSEMPNAVFHLCYETNPDTTTFDFLPGIGITAFTYRHHGTVGEVNLHLINVIVPSYQAATSKR